MDEGEREAGQDASVGERLRRAREAQGDEHDVVLDVDDRLTGGLFAAELARARGTGDGSRPLRVTLSGRWEGGDRTTYTGTVALNCAVREGTDERTHTLTVPNRGAEVTAYAAQYAAWTLTRHLTGHPHPEDPA